MWTRKIPETKETRTTCTNKYYVFLMILGYNLSLFWSSDSIFVRCWFVDVSLIQGPSRLNLGWTVGSFFKGLWAWSLKVDLSESSRSRWGLILRMSVSSRAVKAWSWITVMNGSSRAFGLDFEEQWLDVWICRRLLIQRAVGAWSWKNDERRTLSPRAVGAWSWRWMIVDPKGCWGLILDERMMNDGAFFKGRRGLILNWWMIVDPKGRWGLILGWTKNEESFLDFSGTWMLESFGVSELQSFKV